MSLFKQVAATDKKLAHSEALTHRHTQIPILTHGPVQFDFVATGDALSCNYRSSTVFPAQVFLKMTLTLKFECINSCS